MAGSRVDQALAELLPGRSRAQIQQWIRDGLVRIGTLLPRQRDKVSGGESVEIDVPEPQDNRWRAQSIALEILYEDETLLVVNKPAGLVVHPGAGNSEGTLLNALISHAPQLRTLARAGIVHRLDKETSGLLVVAKTEAARLNLIDQLQARTVTREYLAVVSGVMVAGGTVDAPVGRHPRHRIRMAVIERGKPAVTHYRVQARYRAHTLVRLRLETGRTHQIRVHMAYIHYPLVGDTLYGGRMHVPAGCSKELRDVLRGFRRQALHASKLGLLHPEDGRALAWEAPLPQDMQQLIGALERDNALAAGQQNPK